MDQYPQTTEDTGDDWDAGETVPEPWAHVDVPARSKGFWWFAYLLFRPGVFFRDFMAGRSYGFVALEAWLLGIAGVIDQIAERSIRAELGGRENPFGMLLESWSAYWGACLLLGALGGLLYWSVGGWWYKVRIAWSGHAGPDATLARRVYLLASQVYAVPAILYTLWETLNYATPRHAWEGDDSGALLVVAFLMWSLYTSYRGVRTAFDVRKWVARLWFLILPALFYSMALAVIIAVSLIQSGFFSAEPDIDNHLQIRRVAFSLAHPGNWEVDTQDEDYDPDHWFQITSMTLADAVVTFTIYDDRVDPAEEAGATLAGLASQFDIVEQTDTDTWGGYLGSGYEFRIDIDGVPYEGLIFVANGDRNAFEVMELCDGDSAEQQLPGFELIRRTFRLREK